MAGPNWCWVVNAELHLHVHNQKGLLFQQHQPAVVSSRRRGEIGVGLYVSLFAPMLLLQHILTVPQSSL